jgi:hypothetical protein
MNRYKKQQEKFYLDRFRKSYPHFPCGTIYDSEKPDFLVRTDSSIIGIELRYIYRAATIKGDPQRAQESLRTSILMKAEEIYNSGGALPIQANVFFTEMGTLEKKGVPAIAATIAAAVAGVANMTQEHMFEVLDDDYNLDAPQLLPDCVHSVWCIRLPSSSKARFTVSPSGSPRTMNSEYIQSLIDEKNRLLPGYDPACSFFWLVLVEEGNNASSFLEFSPDALKAQYSTSFQSIFYFKNFTGEYFELRTIPLITESHK